jgi:hypothetical protein
MKGIHRPQSASKWFEPTKVFVENRLAEGMFRSWIKASCDFPDALSNRPANTSS